MSNEAFRVVVERPSIERPVFKAFTILFVLLLILAAAGAVFDVRRKGIRAAFQKIPVAGIDEEGRRLVKDYHRCWNNRKINDADIISCDRKRIEQYIEELKLEREVAFDKRRTIRKRKHIAAKLPIVGSWISGGGSYDDEIMVVSDAENVGNAHRLDDLITFLLKEKMLSAFNGTAIGWDAMNAMTKRSLGLPGAEDSSPDSKGNGRDIIRPDSSEVVERVSEYFERVLKDGEVHANLFSHAWEVNDGDPEYLLTKSVALPGEILIDGKAFKRLDLEVNLPKDEATESGIEPGNTFDLCLFGKLVHKNYSKDGVEPHLILHFQQMAVLRDVSDSI